jgi:hypothetical protein
MKANMSEIDMYYTVKERGSKKGRQICGTCGDIGAKTRPILITEELNM